MSNTELAEKPKALAIMASRLSVEPEKMLKTLKDTVFKNASDSELLALVVVSNEYGLNPLLREIYAFPAKGGGITPVVSIDGWISMVNRQPQLDGIEFDMKEVGDKPTSCTCSIHIKGRKHPVKVTEYYDECFRATEPWQKMPRRMLRHKSLKEAARVAFGFSGITDDDEANDIKPARAFEVKRTIAKPKFVEDTSPEIKEPEGGEQPENSHNKQLDSQKEAPSGEESQKIAYLGPQPVERLIEDLTELGINQQTFVAAAKLVFEGIPKNAKIVQDLRLDIVEQALQSGVQTVMNDAQALSEFAQK